VGPTGGRQRWLNRLRAPRGGGGGDVAAGPRAWLGHAPGRAARGRGRGEKEKFFSLFSNLFSK
jgi:hypothetical protein